MEKPTAGLAGTGILVTPMGALIKDGVCKGPTELTVGGSSTRCSFSQDQRAECLNRQLWAAGEYSGPEFGLEAPVGRFKSTCVALGKLLHLSGS